MGVVAIHRNEVTMSTTIDLQKAAHQRATKLGLRETVRRLNTSLGATLVSALAGVKDTKLAHKWAKDEGPQPRPEAVQRLVFAYAQWQLVAEAEGEHVARVWFIGANPWLEHDTPIDGIREGRYKEVATAARALVDDSFSG